MCVLDGKDAIDYSNYSYFFSEKKEAEEENVASKITISWRARVSIQSQASLHLLSELKNMSNPSPIIVFVCVCALVVFFSSQYANRMIVSRKMEHDPIIEW